MTTAAMRLLARSKGNEMFQPFFPDLFDPFVIKISGETDSEAIAFQNMVLPKFAAFAVERAAILTRAEDQLPAAPAVPGLQNMLDLLYDKNTAHMLEADKSEPALERRWKAIRDADCLAYPVPDCTAKLDQAMSRILSPIREGRRDRPARRVTESALLAQA